MLASNKGALGRSSLTTTSRTNKSVAGKRDNFVVYIFKRIMAMTSYLWSKGRSFLWVGSTGMECWIICRVYFVDIAVQFCLFDGISEGSYQDHGRYFCLYYVAQEGRF